MAAIRSTDLIARKWASVTPQRVADYEAGIRDPRTDWAQATQAADGSWKAGVQAAIAAGSFKKGVARAGTQKWATGAIEKGTQRWGPGVALAEDNYAQGLAPYQQAISSLTLPPRFARRDPRNLERVKAVVDALIKTKAALT